MMTTTRPDLKTSTTSTSNSSNSSKNVDELDALLEQSQQLIANGARVGTRASYHHIPKNLTSIYQQSRKLNQKVTRTVSDTAPKGDYLLAQKGFNVEKYRRGLHALDLKSAFEPLEPLGETDIEAYLRHQHSMIMLTAIEEAKKSTSNQFYKTYDAYLDSNWKSAKEELQRILGLHKNTLKSSSPAVSTDIRDYSFGERGSISQYRPTPFQVSGIEQLPYTPGKRGRTMMDSRMIEYSSVVYKLNLARRSDTFFPLITSFMEHAELIDERESRKRQVMECWNILKYMLYEQDAINRGVMVLVGAQDMIEGAKRSLEAQYAQLIHDIVMNYTQKQQFEDFKNQNPNTSPNLLLILRFLSVAITKGQYQDSHKWERWEGAPSQITVPLWATIFYCLRCGFVNEAIYVADKSPTVKSKPVLYNLIQSKARGDSRIPIDHNAIMQEYRAGGAITETQTDIFKTALYLLLGRVEPSNTFKKVFSKTEDWIWYKLHLTDVQGLAKFQDLISVSLGANYFCQRRDSLKYFKLLLLTQQFEKAIEYLAGLHIEGFDVEAVHFAIALLYYKQLNCSKDPNSPLISTDGRKHFINFISIIRQYVQIFAHTDPRDAVSYIYVLEMLAHNGLAICLENMTRLVVESKDITTLLGTSSSEGVNRRKGCIEDFLDREQILEILEDAAKEFKQNGKYALAVELYFMAAEHQRPMEITEDNKGKTSQYLINILMIMNDELSQVLNAGGNRDMVIQLANKVNSKFIRENLNYKLRKEDEGHFKTFSLLLQLTNFFNLFQAKKYNEAYSLISRFGFLGLQKDKIDDAVIQFNDLDDTIQRKISEIIVACMTVLKNLYTQEQSKLSPSYKQLDVIRSRANALLSFAGNIQNHVNADSYGKLIKMNVAMGS